MTDSLKKDLSEEISFMQNWLAYPDDELVPMETLEDARIQIEGMVNDYDGPDFPEALKIPEIMLLVFNYCVGC